MNRVVRLTSFMLLSHAAFAQSRLHLNLKQFDPERTAEIRELKTPPKRQGVLRSHLLIQFSEAPSAALLRSLSERGIALLGYIPDHGFAISAPDGVALDDLGVRWYGRLGNEEKLSAAFGPVFPGRVGNFIVEFYPDVDMNEARAIIAQSGLLIRDHPDLLPNHLQVVGAYDQLPLVAAWDEVAYIFPTSEDLVRGAPVRACAGAITSLGPVSQAIPTIGNGWDGPGLGSANLLYAFAAVTARLPADSVKSEIVRAFAEWARHAALTFSPTNGTNGARTISVLFASRAHGDPYPFDGPGGLLAHTFYPYPFNPEPIAGDMHFDSDETWKVGADTDVYSVALHEAGHALGLGHSDNPNAVMYPYYRRHTVLSHDDVDALLTLYAAQNGPPGPGQPTPPGAPVPTQTAIQILSPTSNAVYGATVSTVTLSGTSSGSSPVDRVTWSNSQGSSGRAFGTAAWNTGPIALIPGFNAITVTAWAHNGGQVSSVLKVTYAASPVGGADSTPPSLTILSPGYSVHTSAAGIVFKGTASDNVGVAAVTWSNSNGGSGVASGSTAWITPSIPLLVGANTITIRASDAAGNTSWRSVVVTRR